MTESSRPHGDQTSRWEDELDGGRGPEGAGGCLDMKELGEILRSKIVYSFECKEEDHVNYAVFEGESMKLLQDRCYVADGGGSGNDAGSRVLD